MKPKDYPLPVRVNINDSVTVNTDTRPGWVRRMHKAINRKRMAHGLKPIQWRATVTARPARPSCSPTWWASKFGGDGE